MKNLVILGAGAFARAIYNVAINTKEYNKSYVVKGFLDIDAHALDGYNGYPPYLGCEIDYEVCEKDIFVTAIGDNYIRKKVVDIIEKKGGTFITLIHKTATINTNAKIGIGSIIQPYSFVDADACVGDHTYIQNNSIVGHDASVGSFCRIDANVVFVGGTKADDFVTVHSNAVINHKVTIGDNSIVGACSFVIRKVKPNTTVCGNPAKVLKF